MGRGRELAQLDTALERTLSGRGGLILLTGEPGIGKTTLAREFVEHAAARGAAWAWGSCWDGGGAPAYWPWVQVGRVLSRSADMRALRSALGAGAPWITRMLPELAATLGPAAQASELDSEQARFRLFDALATLLGAAAEQRPLVIVLDDLHWADASSLLALEFVSRVLPEIPLLAIASYRHAEAHARADLATPLGGLARAATRLPLEGLSREEVAQLAALRARGLTAAGPGLPPALLDAVHQASGGNPFFVDELVQLLASQGRLREGDAVDVPLPLPDGVRDAIRRRLDPFDAFVLQALQAAAVIGGEFDVHLLASVLDEPAGTLLARLDQPLRAGLIRRDDDAGRFRFAHALVRDTLLEGLGATRRARLHLVTAEALEEVHRDDLEQQLGTIAHHYLQAASEDGAERAVDFAARAAERAVALFAYEEAVRLYERALDVAAALPADEERAWRLWHGLGEARMRAGDIEGARCALRTAADHARHLDDPQRLARTALATAVGTFSPGIVEPELVAIFEEALARLDAMAPRDPPRQAVVDALRCRLRVQLALALYWSPRRERREQLVDEALTLARSLYTSRTTGDVRAHRLLGDRTLAFALAQGFLAVWGPETVTRGLPISVEALELCERTNDAELAMLVRLWRISLLLELDDPVRAEEEIEAFGLTARRLGQPRMLVWDPLHRAMAAHMRGDFAACERFIEEARARSRDVPGSIAPITADSQMFLVRRTQGRHLDLEPLVRKNADRLPAMRRWRCGLALVLAELGREDEARRELEYLAAADFEDVPRDALWLVAMSLLAELCALLGDRKRARRLYELLVPYEGRNVVSMGAAYLGPVARYLGLLAMTSGEDERALGHLETARSAAERMGARPTVVLTALDAAEVLARRAAPEDAQRGRTLVQRVAADAAQMQMAGAIARADDLLARLEEVPAAGRLAPRTPVRAALCREQDVWVLEFGGRRVCLQDVKGLHHLATLLASPGVAIAATDLAAGVAGGRPGRHGRRLDALRERALELREDIEEARILGDLDRIARLRDELEGIAAASAAAEAGSSAEVERARVNVTRAIKAALGRIAEHEPELARLLRSAVRTGASCRYEPDPGAPLEWQVRT